MDFWFMEDGQIACAPEHAETVLRVLGEELARIGATRGEGGDVKSEAHAFGTDGVEWATDYVRRTCKLPQEPSHVLGIDVGGEGVPSAQFEKLRAKTDAVQAAISEIGDAGVELVLTRRCAGVCKVTRALRAAGTSITSAALAPFDDRVRESLEHVAGGALRDTAYLQATLGVRESGLGLRRAEDLALPAFIASRVAARPFIDHVCRSFEGSQVPSDEVLRVYDLSLIHI